ncbi:DUF1918 domain-containing protein [Streptomyces boninensis]|uniref:DUF1918 domain-containing protein n=1 Tax=Streptomyces boninensis TaxID=2039455 RepID=UPI003B22247D
MRANKGDKLCTHGRTVGQHDKTVEVIEVLGSEGPYRVRDAEGHESVLSPGPDTTRVAEGPAGEPGPR